MSFLLQDSFLKKSAYSFLGVSFLVVGSYCTRYTHIKVAHGKGYSINTINVGEDSMYTSNEICTTVHFLINNIIAKLVYKDV